MSKAFNLDRGSRQKTPAGSDPAEPKHTAVYNGRTFAGTIYVFSGGWVGCDVAGMRIGAVPTKLAAMALVTGAARKPTSYHLAVNPGRVGFSGKSAKFGGRHHG